MKKQLLYLAAGLLALTASCSNDAPEGAQAGGGDALVTCELSVPASLDTRAYGDGSTANYLHWLVLDAEGNVIFNEEQDAFASSLTESVNFRLVRGKTYTVVFWADVKGNSFYTFNPDGTISVNYAGAIANDETRDAFFGSETFKVEGSVSKTFSLKRPFAQLNVGTTRDDYIATVAAGTKVTRTGLKINTYETLNLITGAVSDPTAVEVIMSETSVPNRVLGNNPTTDLHLLKEVNGEIDFVWLSMNYVLCGSDSEVFNQVTMTTHGATVDKVFGSVPLQRNYRTNIVGGLFTSDFEYNVVIEPAFKTPDNVLGF